MPGIVPNSFEIHEYIHRLWENDSSFITKKNKNKNTNTIAFKHNKGMKPESEQASWD